MHTLWFHVKDIDTHKIEIVRRAGINMTIDNLTEARCIDGVRLGWCKFPNLSEEKLSRL